mmetsp:Transcript_36258/g.100658  ORF Transcript_36258/g.100658 Transcript_36258/m.100658 type:complete len:213 (+) Transcript_36258:163-801(+)
MRCRSHRRGASARAVSRYAASSAVLGWSRHTEGGRDRPRPSASLFLKRSRSMESRPMSRKVLPGFVEKFRSSRASRMMSALLPSLRPEMSAPPPAPPGCGERLSATWTLGTRLEMDGCSSNTEVGSSRPNTQKRRSLSLAKSRESTPRAAKPSSAGGASPAPSSGLRPSSARAAHMARSISSEPQAASVLRAASWATSHALRDRRHPRAVAS